MTKVATCRNVSVNIGDFAISRIGIVKAAGKKKPPSSNEVAETYTPWAVLRRQRKKDIPYLIWNHPDRLGGRINRYFARSIAPSGIRARKSSNGFVSADRH